MMSCRTKSRIHAFFSGVLLLFLSQVLVIPHSYAAPGGWGGGMGMGMGTPAECDAALSVTTTQALQFGMVAAPTAGTVIVDTAGTRTATGGIVLVTGGTVSAGSFTLSTAPTNCQNRNLVTVAVTSPAILTSGPNTMTLDSFVTTPVAGDKFAEGMSLLVGGTLHVNTLQPPGTYTGTFMVTVTFQ